MRPFELDKLGLVEIWDWLAQVRDELSIKTLQQKQQGQIDEPTYVQTKTKLEDLAKRFTVAKRKRNWDRLIGLTRWFPAVQKWRIRAAHNAHKPRGAGFKRSRDEFEKLSKSRA